MIAIREKSNIFTSAIHKLRKLSGSSVVTANYQGPSPAGLGAEMLLVEVFMSGREKATDNQP